MPLSKAALEYCCPYPMYWLQHWESCCHRRKGFASDDQILYKNIVGELKSEVSCSLSCAVLHPHTVRMNVSRKLGASAVNGSAHTVLNIGIGLCVDDSRRVTGGGKGGRTTVDRITSSRAAPTPESSLSSSRTGKKD